MPRRPRFLRAPSKAVVTLVAGVTWVSLSGCSSSGPSKTTGPSTGSLTVTITAPNGVTPSVTVNGPGGYSKSLSATQTLSGLATGSYTVSAARVVTTAAIVSTADTAAVSGSPASVTAAGTANAAATYAQVPGSGGLWAGGPATASTVFEYSAESGTPRRPSPSLQPWGRRSSPMAWPLTTPETSGWPPQTTPHLSSSS